VVWAAFIDVWWECFLVCVFMVATMPLLLFLQVFLAVFGRLVE